MSGIYYPKASRTQWFGTGTPIKPNCVVIHTTETRGWPGYQGGAVTPTLTMHPIQKRWRQHIRIDRSARALENHAGGVETNTLNCIQIELIGTCDPSVDKRWRRAGYKRNRDYIYWRKGKAPDWALAQVAEFVDWAHRVHGIKRKSTKKPWVYRNSWGYNARQRMSNSQWRNFYGYCGHQHVPENSHFDPADMDMKKVLRMARSGDTTVIGGSGMKAKDVWNWDGINAPAITKKGNDKWMAKSALGVILRNVTDITNKSSGALHQLPWFITNIEHTQDKMNQRSKADSKKLDELIKAVSGGSVDSQAIAESITENLLSELGPTVQQAIEDSRGASAEEIANTVVATMGNRMSQEG